jgi:hypothetical protein
VKPYLIATHHQTSSFDAVNVIQVKRALQESKMCSVNLVNHSLELAETSAKLRYFANTKIPETQYALDLLLKNSGSFSVQDLAFSPLFLKIAKNKVKRN